MSSASSGKATSPQPPQQSCTIDVLSLKIMRYSGEDRTLTGVIVHLSQHKPGVPEVEVGNKRIDPSCVRVSTRDGKYLRQRLLDGEGDGDVVQLLVIFEPHVWRHLVPAFLQPLEACLTISRAIWRSGLSEYDTVRFALHKLLTNH